jgi:hypothetical protein
MRTQHDSGLQQAAPRWAHAMPLIAAAGFVLLLSNASITAARTQRAAAPAAQRSSFRPAASVQQVMTLITVPASDAIFGAAGEPPKTADAWNTLQNNALLLAESGNLLMLPGRARDNAEWAKQSRAMIDAAMLAVDAAKAKNADKFADLGDKIYVTCEACHDKYMAK